MTTQALIAVTALAGAVAALVTLQSASGASAAPATSPAAEAAPKPAEPRPSRLAVLWTSADPGVAHNVCFMYTGNAKAQGWFDEVQLIVWGPSARLLAEDVAVQAAVKGLQQKGVEVRACVACADRYGVSDKLRELGIEVRPMGQPLTEILKSDWKVLTF